MAVIQPDGAAEAAPQIRRARQKCKDSDSIRGGIVPWQNAAGSSRMPSSTGCQLGQTQQAVRQVASLQSQQGAQCLLRPNPPP
jgi:hypothetical protein